MPFIERKLFLCNEGLVEIQKKKERLCALSYSHKAFNIIDIYVRAE